MVLQEKDGTEQVESSLSELFKKHPPDVKSQPCPGKKACQIRLPVERFLGMAILVDLCGDLLVAPGAYGGTHRQV
jgi:hypothetical protein